MMVMLRRTCLCLSRLRNTFYRQINSTGVLFPDLIRHTYSAQIKLHKFGCRESNKNASTSSNENDVDFEKACVETLESLTDYFEEIVENADHLKSADVSYSDGVLTVNFGHPYGSYVINRQSPNRQIWLSSPTSGPKRYDFVPAGSGHWVYKHDGVSLHELLQKEIEPIIKTKVSFLNLVHGNK